MAVKLPEEDKLFQQLKDEKVIISTDIWTLVYSHVEDSLSAIKLLLTFHLDRKEDVPVNGTQRVYDHVLDVFSVFRKIINPQIIKTEDKGFIKVKEESKLLHPVIKALFGHYIGNDMQSLAFIVGDCLDSKEPLSRDSCDRVLKHIADMERFLQKLRMSTETQGERIRNCLTGPLVYLKNLKDHVTEADVKAIEKCIFSLEEIDKLVEKER